MFMCLRLVPVVPALGTDVTAQLAIDEDGLRVFAPRTAQIAFRHAVVRGQPAIPKDETAGLPFARGGCRNERIGQRPDFAIAEQRRSGPENKIGRTLDIAFREANAGIFGNGLAITVARPI